MSASSALMAACSCATCAFWVSTSCGVAQPFCPSVGVAGEIGLGVHELGLIAIALGGHLVELRLVGTRIDLREQVAGMHGLPFGEVDADDLSLDLAAHDDRVVGDDRADAGQIDRHVMLGDRSGDDRHRRDRGCWRRRRPLEREFMVRARTPPVASTTISEAAEMAIFRRIVVPLSIWRSARVGSGRTSIRKCLDPYRQSAASSVRPMFHARLR